MPRGRAVSMATAQAQTRTAIGGRRLRLLALPDDVIAQRLRGARPARGHEGGSAPPSLLGGRGRASPTPLPSPPPLPLPSPRPPLAVGGAWRSAPPPGAWPPPKDRPQAAAAGAEAPPVPPGPARPLGGAGPPTPPRGAGPTQSHAPIGAGQRQAPPPGGEKGRGGVGATPTAGIGGGGAAPPPPRGVGAAPPPPRGGGRSSPERAGGGRGRGRGGASPGLPLPPPRPSPTPLPGPNPDQQRHRRGRGRDGATPTALWARPRPFLLLIGHAPSAQSPAPRPAQPPPEGGARDLRAEHPGRVPAGLREPDPRQRRRGGGEARGHFPAGVQHPPEEGLGAAAAAVLPAAPGERPPARLPRQLQTPRAHHGRPADPLRPQLAQRPGDEHVRGPGHGRRARQGAFLQLLLLRQTAHARLRGRAALDQERGHFREGAAADPHPPGGALVPGGRGRGPQDHHLLRLPAHPQPALPQAHLPLPAGRGRQEGEAGLQGGLERSLQNERRPAEQRQRLRRLRAPVLQVPGPGAPVQLHPAGHAPPAPPDVQGALPLPARPLRPQKTQIWDPQMSQKMGKIKKTRRKCEILVENGEKMEKNGNFWGKNGIFGGKLGFFGGKLGGFWGILKFW